MCSRRMIRASASAGLPVRCLAAPRMRPPCDYSGPPCSWFGSIWIRKTLLAGVPKARNFDLRTVASSSSILADERACFGNTALHQGGLNFKLLMGTQVHYGLERQVTG